MPPSRWLFLCALLPATAAAALIGDSVSGMQGMAIAVLLLLIAIMLLQNRKLRERGELLLQQQHKLNRFLQQSDDFIAILDAKLKPLYVNPALSALQPQLLDTLPLYLEQQSNQLLLPQLQLSDNWLGEAWLKTGDDSKVALSVAITCMTEAPVQYLLLGRDISPLKQRQQQLEQDYLRDAQTGLLSQIWLSEYLQTCIHLSHAAQPRFALLLIKFSQLLGINSATPATTLHFTMADLSQALQQLTGPDYILARYNNDTLAVVVPHHLSNGQTEISLNRLAHKLLTLTDVAATPAAAPLQTLIGISIYPLDGQQPAELIFAANTAVNQAAKAGHSNLVFANSRVQQRAPEYLALETELSKALLQDELDLYYQPRFSIGSNRIVGYEALLRWHNPRRGILTPQHFLTIADETGLIVSLDRLAFRKCCEQLVQWQQTGVNRGRISLNIASLTFRQTDFVAILTAQLKHYGLTAEQFELELHEDILLQADSYVGDTLQQLAALGFHLTLDNFGAGVSSLAVLRQYPLHSLKIAPECIKDMEHNEQQRNITASLIRLASYLQLDVIACGIENEMQAYLLHVMGCDILLGHLFSKALPAAEIPALLAKENKLVSKQVS